MGGSVWPARSQESLLSVQRLTAVSLVDPDPGLPFSFPFCGQRLWAVAHGSPGTPLIAEGLDGDSETT